MPNFSDFVKESVPANYLDDYPKFVLFFEKYYEWLYRDGGFTKAEKDILLNDARWLQTNIDDFIKTGNIQDIASTPDEIEQAIQLMSDGGSPGAVAKNMLPDYLLDRRFDGFNTSEEEVFETADGHNFEAKYRNVDALNSWIQRMGFYIPEDGSGIGNLDRIVLVRLIKHINAIKGTQKSAELFFSIFYDEDITANNGGAGAFFKPKYSILTIDDNTTEIDKKDSVIRDDDYYNEFSYVIRVKNDPSFYKELFDSIYLKYIHPAGFKVFLEQADPDQIVREIHRFFRESQATYIGDDGLMKLVGYNIPRTQNGVLLLEEMTQNLLSWSIDCDTHNGWTLGSSDISNIGKTLSPFGSQNATVYSVDANTGGSKAVQQTVQIPASGTYALSIWAKIISGTDPAGLLTSKWSRFVTVLTLAAGSRVISLLPPAALPVGVHYAISCAQLEQGGLSSSFMPTYLTGAVRAKDIVVDGQGTGA